MALVFSSKDRKESTAFICRDDKTTVNRHKERWHKDGSKCTIVPESSKDAKKLLAKKLTRKTVDKDKETEETAHAYTPAPTQLLPTSTPPLPPPPPPLPSMPPSMPAPAPPSIDEHTTIEAPVTKPNDSGKKSCQTTLLQYRSNLSKPGQDAPAEEEATMGEMLKLLKTLKIDIDSMKNPIQNACHIAYSNNGKEKIGLESIKRATNIMDLQTSCEYLDWFYDEELKSGILRCKPCFDFQVLSKPVLRGLTPTKALEFLSATERNTFSCGITYQGEKCSNMMIGGNEFWYRQKRRIIEHLCFIGEGSALHKKSMEEYQANKTRKKNSLLVSENIFRSVIAALKMGAAGMHFETLISLISSCGGSVGSIGHGRKQFNDICYCLEAVINRETNTWLNTPLLSTGMPPHFWATLDKATPSRITNQAVLIVARNQEGKPCPIPVNSPDVYQQTEEASYDILAEQMVDAIEKNFSAGILKR